jgi:ribokinase
LVRTVVIGAVNWDITLFVKRFPSSGEEIIVKRIARVPGGKAGNTAVAAARLLGPSQVAIFGGIGNDSIGNEHVKIFEAEGVVTSGLKLYDDAESGQAYITVDEDGENIIFKHPGANNLITPQDLDDPVRRRLIDGASVMAIMDPPFETAVKLAEMAKRVGKVVAWDPGVNSELGLENVEHLVRNVDYLIANEHEIENLTGMQKPEAAAERLSSANKRMKPVVKLGGKGCAMYSGGKKDELPKLDLTRVGLTVMNTVGCGDAFLGAFIAALTEGLSDHDALRWGNCAGGLKATRLETRGSPDRPTLLKYLS